MQLRVILGNKLKGLGECLCYNSISIDTAIATGLVENWE